MAEKTENKLPDVRVVIRIEMPKTTLEQATVIHAHLVDYLKSYPNVTVDLSTLPLLPIR
jgi:hypothetical protein